MHERTVLVDAIVYLAAAVIFVPIASRLRLGSVLGYLAAGCVIGPFGVGLVRNVESILHFAELGVVLMLFVIGLELEPSRLWQMRRSVFGGGALQMVACGLVLAAGCLVAGLPWKGALVAGLAVALSSTAIAVQTMKERGLLSSPMGKAAFGILLFQDIAAIPLVGVVPLLSEEASTAGGPRWLGFVKVLGAIIGVVVIGRFATRPALRAIAKTHLREVSTAFALLLVIGIAQLMDLVGVSMGLGAFLAGVLLASSEYRHALESDIEPFKGLLMGLFFIAVGMSIDFGLLASQPLLLLALVLGFTLLKTGALYLVARRLGMSRGPSPQGLMFAALLSQGGELAFVVFGVARAARLLPGDWDKRLTLTVALSMALTPILVILAGFLQRRARPAAAREPDKIEARPAPATRAISSNGSSRRIAESSIIRSADTGRPRPRRRANPGATPRARDRAVDAFLISKRRPASARGRREHGGHERAHEGIGVVAERGGRDGARASTKDGDERELQPRDRRLGDAAAPEPDLVERAHAGAIAGGDHEGRHVALHHRPAGEEGALADPHEGRERDAAAGNDVRAQRHVPAEQRGVGEDHRVADEAVVRDVRADHEEPVAPDRRDAAAVRGAPVDGDVLTEDVAVPDLEPGRLAPVASILRLSTEHGEGVDHVVDAEASAVAHHRVRLDPRPGPHHDVAFDHRERPDLHPRGELGGRGHDRGGVNHGCRSTIEASSSPSAQSVPSTLASPRSFHTLER